MLPKAVRSILRARICTALELIHPGGMSAREIRSRLKLDAEVAEVLAELVRERAIAEVETRPGPVPRGRLIGGKGRGGRRARDPVMVYYHRPAGRGEPMADVAVLKAERDGLLGLMMAPERRPTSGAETGRWFAVDLDSMFDDPYFATTTHASREEAERYILSRIAAGKGGEHVG